MLKPIFSRKSRVLYRVECDIQKPDESNIQEPDHVLWKNAMEMIIYK